MTTVQVRRGTAAEWLAADPTLAEGELGLDTTNNILKLGDGSTAWGTLNPVLSNTYVPAALTYRPIGTRSCAAINSKIQNVGGTSKTAHWAPYTCHGLMVGYPNWTKTFNGADVDGPNSIVYKVGVEVSSTIYPMVSMNGSLTVTAEAGATAWFYCEVDLPAGTKFFLRCYASVSAGEYWINNGNTTGTTDGDGFVSTSDFSASGTINQSNSFVVYPVAILGLTPTAKPSMLLVGDSIMYGTGDTLIQIIRGFGVRALGTSVPWSNIALASETAAHWATQANRIRQLQSVRGFSHALCEYGVNDLVTTNSPTFTVVGQALSNVWQILLARGMKVRQTTLTPQTTSTDSWATTGNQTISTSRDNGVRISINDWIRAGAPLNSSTLAPVAIGTAGAILAGSPGHPLVGYDEIADVVETARNSGIWKAAYTADGLHPSPTAHAAMAAAVTVPTTV